MNEIDLYAVLDLTQSQVDDGVTISSVASVLRQAYRRAVLRCHPDKPGGDKEAFQQVQFAYTILSDATKRRHYNRHGLTDDLVDDWSTTARNALDADDVDAFAHYYRGSDEERADLCRLYVEHEGDIELITDNVWFGCADEMQRYFDALQREIDAGRLDALKAWRKPTTTEMDNRRQWERDEAAEAVALLAEVRALGQRFGEIN